MDGLPARPRDRAREIRPARGAFQFVKLAHTPTCCRAPESSKSPSSNEPTAVRSLLVPPKSRDYAVAFPLMFDLEHHALVRTRTSHATGLAITPSSPAPSKRRNQSAATLAFPSRRRQMNRRRGGREQSLELLAARFEWCASQIAVALAEEVEEHHGCRESVGIKAGHARQPDEGAVGARRNSGLLVWAITISPSSTQRGGNCARSVSTNFRKVTVQWFFIAALNLNLISVTKNQSAKTVPLRFENPRFLQPADHPLAWRAWAVPEG